MGRNFSDMKLTEQNYPLLRYLKWSQDISRHPEMVRHRRDTVKNKIRTELPFLNLQQNEFYDSFDKEMSNAFKIRKMIFESWQELQPAYSSNIEIISKNFLLALERSYDAFLKPELFEEIAGEFNGTLILPGGEAICYRFEMAQPHWDEKGQLRYGVAGDAIRIDTDGNRLVLAVIDDKAYDAVKAKLIDRHSEDAEGIFDIVIVHALFKRYAEIRTVDAKSIKRPLADEPELKTTINGIRFLDASWYTTIVRKEGFGVRGHFRLQPCGPHRSDKKLIYIHEYQKNGYVRRAKLLKEKENNH